MGENLRYEIDQLSQELKLTLTLFYLEGFSYKEISQTLEIPLGTVMSRLFTACRILKRKLLESVKSGKKSNGL